ncbi:MAG: molybdopterin cofactor-binding domain-containing protein, partial [Bacteroidota bacterium]
MTFIKTSYNRRAFLKTSALAGGGLMIGFNWLSSCQPASAPAAKSVPPLPTGPEMPQAWNDLNAFLKIGENGVVTIMSPNPEIGQNVKTSMPMIVAEELDVDWKDVVVEQAGFDNQKYTRQLAGGSQSIRQGWESLRTAGATARAMLVAAAAEKWEVPASEITTADGVLYHKGSNRQMGYGEVATPAGAMIPPEEVALKDPKDFKIIGSDRRNVDGPALVQGKPLFGLDYKKEGMRIAMAVHAPAFGMKIKSLNADKIGSMPGIEQVFVISPQAKSGDKQWSENGTHKEMVAIVGATTWEVMKAKKALEVEWEADGKLENTSEHAFAMTEQLSSKKAKVFREDGDVDAAFDSAAKVVEKTFSAPFLAHNPMEPMNFFADVTAEKAELVGPIQTPEFLSKSASNILGLPEDKISIMMTRMGGGFGRRLYGHFGIEAALISKQAGVPVKLIYTREDDMTYGIYRPAYMVSYRAALDEAGNMTAFHVKGTGIHGSPLFPRRFPAGAVDNYKAEGFSLDSNISTGAWRAPRSNFIAYAEQAFLDEVAEAAGKDPVDFRLDLFERAQKNPVGEKNDYDAARYAGVLELVKQKADWGKAPEGVSRGVSAYFCHNSYVAQVVDVVMEDQKPKVQKVWCAVDCGIVVNPIPPSIWFLAAIGFTT